MLTRLLVSGRSPEGSDCLLRFMERSSSNIKKFNEIKKFFFLKCEIFYENHPPTRHIKYKRIDFAPCNKTIMANKLRLTILERFLRRINSPLTR